MHTLHARHHTNNLITRETIMKMNIILAIALISFSPTIAIADSTNPTQGLNQDGTGGWRKAPLAPGEKEPHNGIEIIWQDPKAQQDGNSQVTNQSLYPITTTFAPKQ